MNQLASSAERAAHRLALGRLELDLLTGELLTPEGELAGLRKQGLEVLLLLGRRAGQVVGKDELLQTVWPRVVVGEGSLTQAIADIRKVLGDNEHRLVRNVARRGYMLVPGSAAAAAPKPDAGAQSAQPPTVEPSRRARLDRRWVLGATVAAGVVLLAWFTLREPAASWQTPAAAQQALREQVPALSLAVLPPTLEGDAGDLDWLAGALHGDLITQLGRAPNTLVIAPGTMARYVGKAAVDPREVARELGVRHVVRGSLRREGDAIRLNFALVDGDSGVQRWGESYVTQHATLAQTLGDFASQLERSLQMQVVLAGAARRAALSPEQANADELAMRAYALWYRGFTRENLAVALPLLERAVQLDPDSTRGWQGISFMNVHAYLNGWQPDRAAARARIDEAVANLERIDRDGNYTYSAKTVPLHLDGNVAGMLDNTQAWVDLHRTAISYGAHGMSLLCNGRFDDAATAEQRALRLSPLDPIRAEWQYRLAMSHFAAGRYDLAREWGQTAVNTNPGLRWAPIHAAALWRLGEADAAREAVRVYLARHTPLTPAQLTTRLTGKEPRLVEARDRLMAALREAGMP
jgi:DNA-binding winged helix-turn-helix (wHTH) protein/TolB-like protein